MTDADLGAPVLDEALEEDDQAFLRVRLDAWEGPLHLLLALARRARVDLTQVSMASLAEQYLAYVARVAATHLETAADYLVMAAHLAWLKSRLLVPLPEEDGDGAPSPEDAARRLAFRLRKLKAMRILAESLEARPRVGRDVFSRGSPEGTLTTRRAVWEGSQRDLLAALASVARARAKPSAWKPPVPAAMPLAQARERLAALVPTLTEWRALTACVPPSEVGKRAAIASTFAAALEMARERALDIRQDAPFGPTLLRRHPREA